MSNIEFIAKDQDIDIESAATLYQKIIAMQDALDTTFGQAYSMFRGHTHEWWRGMDGTEWCIRCNVLKSNA